MGGGGVVITHMCHPKGYNVCFLSHFGLKTGIDFDYFGQKLVKYFWSEGEPKECILNVF